MWGLPFSEHFLQLTYRRSKSAPLCRPVWIRPQTPAPHVNPCQTWEEGLVARKSVQAGCGPTQGGHRKRSCRTEITKRWITHTRTRTRTHDRSHSHRVREREREGGESRTHARSLSLSLFHTHTHTKRARARAREKEKCQMWSFLFSLHTLHCENTVHQQQACWCSHSFSVVLDFSLK